MTNDNTPVTIRAKTPQDTPWVEKLMMGGGAVFIISRMRKLYPAELPGFVAEDSDGSPAGLATYEITGDQCELVTIDALNRHHGVGTALIEEVVRAAREAGCRRLWLITTNDNIEAMRFYQRRGFALSALYVNELTEYRRLKPSIPQVGNFGIVMRDMIEFDMPL